MKKGWSVFWRPDKKRFVLSRDGKQKIIPPEAAKNKREADAWARAYLTQLGELKPNGARRRREAKDKCEPLMREWVAHRKANPEKWTDATVTGNESHCENHLIPQFGSTEVDLLNAEKIMEWIRDFRKKRAQNTVHNVYRTFVSFLDWCQDDKKLIQSNPAKESKVLAELPDSDESRDDVDLAIPVETAQALVSSKDIPLLRRVRYALAFTIPSRDGELAGLTFSSVDFLRNSVSIRQAVKIKRSKDSATIGKPKTRRSKRTVALHPCAQAALLDWQREGWAVLVGRNPTPDDPILPGRNASFSRQKVAAQLRDDLETIGAPTSVDGIDWVFHHTRGTVLNWLRDHEVEQSIRDYLAGHAPKSVGAKSYEKFPLKPLQEAVGKIPLTWPGLAGESCAVPCAAVTTELAATGTDGVETQQIPTSITSPGRLSSVVEQRFRNSLPSNSTEQASSRNTEEQAESVNKAHGFGDQNIARSVTRPFEKRIGSCAENVTGEGAQNGTDETPLRSLVAASHELETERLIGADSALESISNALDEGDGES